jgi:hypothetical protein
LRRRGDISWLRRVAIDDVVEFGERGLGAAISTDLVLYFDEHEPAAAAGFFVDAFDSRGPGDRIADAQRLVEAKLTGSPHASGQRHRRQEPAAPGMAVGADLGLARKRQEIQPVPESGDLPAGGRARRLAVQRRRQRRDRCRGDLVFDRGRAPDPICQVHMLVFVIPHGCQNV